MKAMHPPNAHSTWIRLDIGASTKSKSEISSRKCDFQFVGSTKQFICESRVSKAYQFMDKVLDTALNMIPTNDHDQLKFSIFQTG